MNAHGSFSYEQANKKLIEFVPSLSSAYCREQARWQPEEPGPHVLYDEILNPHIISLLGSQDPSARLDLRGVFAFVERLAGSNDGRLRDLVAVTILPPLMSDPSLLGSAMEFLGPATRRILKDARRE